MSNYVKIYGMPRTATTFTGMLIQRNLEMGVVVGGLGSKHHPAAKLEEMPNWMRNNDSGNNMLREKMLRALEGTIYPVVTIKNPYSWYQSITRYRDDKIPFEKNYVEYNKHYRSWKNLIENPYKPFGKGIVVKYENLLIDVRKEIQRISNHTGINMRGIKFHVPTKVPVSDEFTEERRQFYLSGDSFGLPDETVEKITNIMDWRLMKFYGYKPIK